MRATAIMPASAPLRDRLDLDARIDHQLRLRGGARRLVAREELRIDAIEAREVARVLQPASASARSTLRSVWRVCASMSPRMMLPSSPFATCPETNTRSPAATAAENGSVAGCDGSL